MKTLFALGLAGLALLAAPSPAAASALLDCIVEARVTDVRQDGYRATLRVLRSSAFGSDRPCIGVGRLIRNVELDRPVAPGEIHSFRYTYYSAMGPRGPITQQSWVLAD